MNKKILIIMLAAAVLLTGCGSKEQETDTDEVLTAVETTVVARGQIVTEYIYSGQVKASEQTAVSSKIQGKVSKVNYDVGDIVTKGSVLFTIDGSDIHNGINVLRSQLVTADANINTAQVNLDLANGSGMQSQLAAARSSVDQLKLSLDSAKRRYDENKALYDAGFIAKQAIDQYENAYNQALISYNQAKESYDILSNQTSTENVTRAKSSLEQAKAGKEAILAQIASQQATLNDTVVTSPISGVVTQCNVVAGAMVSNIMAPFEISNINVVTIDVNISEQNINAISIGDSVDIKISSLSDEKITGRISTVNPVANASTGTYEVKISINNEDRLLKPGMFGQVHFVKEKSDNALVLTRNAVSGSESDKFVFVEENGVVSKVSVTTGIDNGKEIEIISGLSEGQHVVVKGQSFLRDGDSVEAIISETGEE